MHLTKTIIKKSSVTLKANQCAIVESLGLMHAMKLMLVTLQAGPIRFVVLQPTMQYNMVAASLETKPNELLKV